ncbi:MAG: cobalamin biosynthesis protein CbiD [Lachnospiraceae bacterium]|nr:cobalamin biosynthesis protein CbiD [Lachnospiraceae bacterium]
MIQEDTVYVNGKKLRCGYTTGSCAAAAAGCAAMALLQGGVPRKGYSLCTPGGKRLCLTVETIFCRPEAVCCGVYKDAGDDADITDGVLVCATVQKCPQEIRIEGGNGVGRVTRPGLDQPVGEAAINSVPRRMIREQLKEAAEAAGYTGGLVAVISVPEGEEIAKKTFNPRLGIEGGISILGTSGIVEPMSEQALVDTIAVEIRQRAAEGVRHLMLTPGNYGEEFIRVQMGMELEQCVKCSNFVGDALDLAAAEGMASVLLIGHIGKLVKLGSGILNTHSRNADGRMETLAACLLRCGGDADTARQVLVCNTTEEAVEYLRAAGRLEGTMLELCDKIDETLQHRTYGKVRAGAVLFSRQSGLCVCTKEAERMFADGTFCRGRLGSA